MEALLVHRVTKAVCYLTTRSPCSVVTCQPRIISYILQFPFHPPPPSHSHARTNQTKVTILVRFAIEVGVQNMLYVAALYTAGRLVHPTVFLVGTSFVHYLRYMTTYYNRTDVNFGTFKADVLFFKVLAISHIAYRYASILFATPGTSASPVVLAASLVMIVTGSTVSSLATKALGIDGTYFGCELGMCKTEWVTAFPYNVIPHPMIVGQLFAFMGVQLLPEFRAAWPWLMPAHCAMYTLVMLQEQFDVYRGKKAGAPPSGPEKIKSA